MNKSSLLQKFLNLLDDYFESLTTIHEKNIKRILSRNLFHNYADLLSLKKPYYYQEYKELKEHTPEQVSLLTYLIKYYTQRGFEPPANFPEPDESIFDNPARYASKISKAVDFHNRDIRMLYGLDIKTMEYENEGFYDRTIRKGKIITSDDLETLHRLLDSYRSTFEYFIPKLLRKDFDQYIAEIKKGQHHKIREDKIIKKALKGSKPSNKNLIEFFKTIWKKTPIESYLDYFVPDIRNAISHDTWDPDFGSQEFLFKDENAKIKVQLSFSDFINDYYARTQVLRLYLGTHIRVIKGTLLTNSEFIEKIKGNNILDNGDTNLRLIPHVKLLFPNFSILAFFFNLFSDFKTNNRTVQELVDVLIDNLLDGISIPNIADFMPIIIRYILSDYPFEKPLEVWRQILNEYATWVKLDEINDDEVLISQLKEMIDKNV